MRASVYAFGVDVTANPQVFKPRLFQTTRADNPGGSGLQYLLAVDQLDRLMALECSQDDQTVDGCGVWALSRLSRLKEAEAKYVSAGSDLGASKPLNRQYEEGK